MGCPGNDLRRACSGSQGIVHTASVADGIGHALCKASSGQGRASMMPSFLGRSPLKKSPKPDSSDLPLGPGRACVRSSACVQTLLLSAIHCHDVTECHTAVVLALFTLQEWQVTGFTRHTVRWLRRTCLKMRRRQVQLVLWLPRAPAGARAALCCPLCSLPFCAACR